MKSGKGGKGSWSSKFKLGLPATVILCSVYFLAGFYSSSFLSQGDGNRTRVLEAEYTLMPHGETGDDSLTSIPFQVLSWHPRALYFPNFATAEQCETLIGIAKPSLEPSTVALRPEETNKNKKRIRTSQGMFISAFEDKTGTLDAIEEKIARATMLPRSYGEPFNILRYELGQKYLSHYDAFSPHEYGPQKSHRVASFLLYLTDVQEGGETAFPYESGMDKNYNYQDCVGLKVKPRKGDGLLFYSLLPNGTIDTFSMHASCPVIEGEKWVAVKWIRDREKWW